MNARPAEETDPIRSGCTAVTIHYAEGADEDHERWHADLTRTVGEILRRMVERRESGTSPHDRR